MFCVFKAHYSPLLVLFLCLPCCFLAACPMHPVCCFVDWWLSPHICLSRFCLPSWLLFHDWPSVCLWEVVSDCLCSTYQTLSMLTHGIFCFSSPCSFSPPRGEGGLSGCVDACVAVGRSCLRVYCSIRKTVYLKLSLNRLVVKSHLS